jgi:hypothetical protein
MSKNRVLEISAKLVEMGKALTEEGLTTKDMTIVQTGGFMVFIGGIIVDEDDVDIFSQLCAMFSAKKILDSFGETESILGEFLKINDEEGTNNPPRKKNNKRRGGSDKSKK